MHRWVYLLVVVAILSSCYRAKSAFELENKNARSRNPEGVDLQMRTKGDTHNFVAGCVVQVEEFYTAEEAGEWLIEILDGWNVAGGTDVVNISDGTSSWRITSPYGIVCCDSWHRWLTTTPTRIPNYDAYLDHRNDEVKPNRIYLEFTAPSKPGAYQFYVTSERLFSHNEDTPHYTDKGRLMASNLVTIYVTK